MADGNNWRTGIDAEDYLRQQKKKAAVADRRPLIRKASDLVGPGIASQAIRLTDFNDVLATYNGFFSADTGALNAPPEAGPFVGFVVSDAELGGWQTFVSLSTNTNYARTFKRNPADPNKIYWQSW